MKQKITLLTLFLTLSITVFAQKSEEKLVRKAFDNYKTFILNDKGEEAVS